MSRHLCGWGVLFTAAALTALAGCTGSAPAKPDGGGGKDGGGTGGANDVDAMGSGGTGSGGDSAGTGGATAGTGGATSNDGGTGGAMNSDGGGTDASGTGGTTSNDGGGTGGVTGGDAGAANGCVKNLGVWYVVRDDGHVLVEVRDKTKETTILGADGKPLTNATAVTGGYGYGCALLGDATVWCWREIAAANQAGQLGAGTTDGDATAPIERASQVLTGAGQPLTNVVSLTKGADDQSQTCAVTGDGKLYCWGNLTWLVNKGTSLVSPYAQAITTDGITMLTGVIQAAICPTMACAVVKGSPDNALYCWGGNSYGNLATGDSTHRQYPTKITSLKSPTRVSVVSAVYISNVGGTVCAVDQGQVLCWGANNAGETGTGLTTNPLTTPTPVVLAGGTANLPEPSDLVSAPNGTFCALEPNQTIWCWGNGYQNKAGNYGLTNVSILGGLFRINNYGAYPLFLTTDGLYHWGMEWNRSPGCSP